MSEMLIVAIWSFIPYWWAYVVVFGLLPVIGITLVFSLYLVETPHFLINTMRDVKKAKQSLTKIGTYNKADISEIEKACKLL